MPRYAKGQRIQVVSTKNSKQEPKYRDMEPHVGKFGVVIEYHRIGFKMENLPSDYYVYEVRLDDDSIIAVPEDALSPPKG
jgi:hypothetical protein